MKAIRKKRNNKYVNFISDEHLISCISNLHNSYMKAKEKYTRKKFYSNKIDVIKLRFDSKFKNLSEEHLIDEEITRQIDKSINNAIGTFHEEILGGISGYEMGTKSNYDIKSNDDLLFADIKNKHNTMNSGSSKTLFDNLSKFAEENPKAKCYWVQILAKSSFEKIWELTHKKEKYSHERVFVISGDIFYYKLSGEKKALFNLYKALPKAIDTYLKSIPPKAKESKNTVLDEIQKSTKESKRDLIDEIAVDNFIYYFGFDKL